MSSAHINAKGYATPREFSGFQVPVPLQSAAIRRYCDERRLVFNHHVVENITPGTFLVLERIATEAHLFQALAMCSIGMLPESQSHRMKLLESCLTSGMTVHFIFEQLVVTTSEEILEINELLSLTKLLKNDRGRVSKIRELTQTK